MNFPNNVYATMYAGGKYMVTIPMLICPMDPSVSQGMNETLYGGAELWAASSIALNNYVFGNPPSGLTNASNTFAMITDGTSNTIFLSEIYGTCGTGDNLTAANTNTWGSLWADANEVWRPAYNLGASKAGTAVTTYPASPMPQDAPNFEVSCNPLTVQSNHGGGLNVCMGDGSVRFVSIGISPTTWAGANDPRDGLPPGSDW